MRLYVMRHGPAEETAATGRDADRALTSQGRDRVRSVAKVLAAEAEIPLRIVSSRLLRAVETADIVAAVAKASGWEGRVDQVAELGPGGDHADLVVGMARAGLASVMVVGHEPDFSGLVFHLLGRPAPLPMDKGTVVSLELGLALPATLRFVIEPKSAKLVHDARKERG